MDIFSEAFLNLFFQLVPGFIVLWVFYGLTPIPKPDQLDRVINALIYSVIVKILLWGFTELLYFIGRVGFVLGEWSSGLELFFSVLFALIFGLFLAASSTHNIVHGLLKKIGLTDSDSYPSQWYEEMLNATSVSIEGIDTYVLITLNDGKRLYGVLIEPSETQNDGHLVFSPYIWLDDGEPINEDIFSWNPGKIMIPARLVNIVEIVYSNFVDIEEVEA